MSDTRKRIVKTSKVMAKGSSPAKAGSKRGEAVPKAYSQLHRRLLGSSVRISEITTLIDIIDEKQEEIAHLQNELVDDLRVLELAMKQVKKKELRGSTGIGQIYRPASKGSNEVPVRVYRDMVSEEDFLDSISVSVTKAKKHLSGKEFDRIVVPIAAKEKPETVRVVHIKEGK